MNALTYHINKEATLAQGFLVLQLAVKIKEDHSDKFIFPQEGYPLSKWRSLAHSPIDKELLGLALKEELLFEKKKNGRSLLPENYLLKEIHVDPSEIASFLQKLALHQRLFCQQKSLVVDLFGKNECDYLCTLSPEGVLHVEAQIRSKDQTFPLSECAAIGPGKPHPWFVRGLLLKFIHTDISWKRLASLYLDKLSFEGEKKRSFLDEKDEDPLAPRFLMKTGSFESAKIQMTPLPVLKLKDRFGACADLWIDYGEGLMLPFEEDSLFSTPFPSSFKRMRSEETAWEKDLLETDYIKKKVGSSHYYCPLDKVAKALGFLLEVGWKIRDFQDRAVVKQTALNWKMQAEERSIIVKGSLAYPSCKVDLSNIVGVFNRKEHFLQLSTGETALIDFSSEDRDILHTLSEEGEWLQEGCRVSKNRANTLGSLWDHAEKEASLAELKEKLQHFKGLSLTPPSPTFLGTLRPYQQEGVNWLSFLKEYGFHGILADDMGLGKTVQIIAFLSQYHTDKPHLVIAPTSLLFNWKNECSRFLPHLNCYLHHGEGRIKEESQLPKQGLILTSYATLRLDLPCLNKLDYACLILDEAQMIKNAASKTAEAVFSLQAELKVCATGTPIENHLSELWSYFHFLIPDLFGDKSSFEAKLQASASDTRFLQQIKRKITPFLLRRKKEEVAKDLPARIDQVIWIEMGDEQRALYDHYIKHFKSGLLKKIESEGVKKHRIEIFEAILRLRQICAHPLLAPALDEERPAPSAKCEMLFNDLETLVDEGQKVLIYSQFTSMLTLMIKEAKKRGWSCLTLDGSTKNREEVVRQFQEEPSFPLFFVSLKAGGVGLNLTAADYVYLYDPWWNEAVEEQAINRAHRIGRKEAIVAKRLIVRESIEEKMMKLKASKRLLIEEVMEEGQEISSLDAEDLQFLLS